MTLSSTLHTPIIHKDRARIRDIETLRRVNTHDRRALIKDILGDSVIFRAQHVDCPLGMNEFLQGINIRYVIAAVNTNQGSFVRNTLEEMIRILILKEGNVSGGFRRVTTLVFVSRSDQKEEVRAEGKCTPK